MHPDLRASPPYFRDWSPVTKRGSGTRRRRRHRCPTAGVQLPGLHSTRENAGFLGDLSELHWRRPGGWF